MTLNILVAEDSPSFRLLYQKTLEARGHHVITTQDGTKCVFEYVDAISRKSKNPDPPFDLVILDYDMPRRTGLQVADEILETYPKQRILFITGYSKELLVHLRKYRKYQKFELLEKPFSLFSFVRQAEGLQESKWNQKVEKGFKRWDGQAGLSETA